jgi:hypothetical protein
MVAGLLLALTVAQAIQQPGLDRSAVFPVGTRLPVRFAQSINGGRDQAGTIVGVQAMAPLEAGGCIVVSAFTPVLGTVVASRAGRMFNRRGYIELRFDSILVAPGTWVPLAAKLDSLEWMSRGSWTLQGGVRQKSRSIRGIVGTAGVAGLAGAATGLGLIPAVAYTGLRLVVRGPGAQILAGQRGAIVLAAPLVVPLPERCERAEPSPPQTEPVVPALPPHATDKSGRKSGDPINLVLRGTREEMDSAFSRAGWLLAQRSTVGSLAREVEAVILQQDDPAAPMSHEYYLGRMEDLRFERASLSARKRHHVRLWRVDSTGALWAAAAIEDVGMLVSAKRGVTHRVAPDIDRERDLLVGELLAGGCAILDGYATLPGASHTGMTVAGQPFATDDRVAVLRLLSCPRYARPF